MAEPKLKPGNESVVDFLSKVEPEQKRKDSFTLLEVIKEITGEEPVMWAGTMVGFGTYHYKYASGHEGDAFLTGFSPRKASLTLYITPGFEKYEQLLARLGKFKTSKACLYINKLADINMDVLKELILLGYRDSKHLWNA